MSVTATVPTKEAEKEKPKSAQGKAFDRKLFSRVFAFVKPYRITFWVTFVLTIVLAGLGVIRPILMGGMIDDYAMTGDEKGLLWIAVIEIGRARVGKECRCRWSPCA